MAKRQVGLPDEYWMTLVAMPSDMWPVIVVENGRTVSKYLTVDLIAVPPVDDK